MALDEVGGDQRLPAILPAAKERDVDRAPIDIGTDPDRHQIDCHTAPGTTLRQRQNIAAVAIDIHLLGVQVRQP